MAMVDAGRHGTSKAHHRRHSLVWWVLAALSVCCISLWGASHARLAASQTQIDALGERLKALESELRVAKAEKQKESRDLASAKKRISSLQSKALQYEAEAAKDREELSSLSRLREQAADAQHGAAEERGACERRAQAADAELANLRTSMEERRKAHLDMTQKLDAMAHTLRERERQIASLNRTAALQPTENLGDKGRAERLESLAVRLMHGKSQHAGKKSVWGNGKPVHPTLPDPYLPEACSAIGTRSGDGKAALVSKTWVYNAEKVLTDGSIGYAHMAMISTLPAASPWDWLMVWQAAHQLEGAEDQTFMAAYSLDATRWTAPVRMTNLQEQGCLWSPVLHRTASMVWLFYSESVSCKRPANKLRGIPQRWAPGGTIRYIQSEDGVVWSRPATVWEQIKDGGVPKVIANQIVTMRGDPQSKVPGLWILPYWQEVPQLNGITPGCPAEGKDMAGVLLSRDQGKSWTRSKPIQMEPNDGSVVLLEGAVAQQSNGTLLQVFRTRTGELYRSTSLDGITWQTALPSGLPNPNSKVNLLRLEVPDDQPPVMALAYNHNDTSGYRNNLWVALTNDEGGSWRKLAELEGIPDDGVMMHYPTLVQDKCRLLVAYSSLYRMLPKCLPSNPVCTDEVVPTAPTGIRLAEIDLARVEVSKLSLIPFHELPAGLSYR